MTTRQSNSWKEKAKIAEQIEGLLTAGSADSRHSDGPAPPMNDLERRRWIHDVVQKSTSDMPDGGVAQKSKIQLLYIAVAAVFILGVGSLSLYIALKPFNDAPQAQSKTAPAPLVVSPSRQPHKDIRMPSMLSNRALQAGDIIRTGAGATALQLPGHVTLLVESHTRIELIHPDKQPAEIRLHRGKIVASVRKSKTGDVKFVVSTSRGNVEVTGTVFAVKANDDTVNVQVLNGTVHVKQRRKDAHSVTAVTEGEALNFEKGIVRALSATELNSLKIQHQILVSVKAAADAPAVTEQVTSPVIDPPVEAVAKIASKSPRSPKNLIVVARDQRQQKNWPAAIDTYMQILSSSTNRSERGIANNGIGEILLVHLNDPDKALRYFDAYLKEIPGGPLEQEAAFGRIRALGRLQRIDEERRAIEAFIERHPNAVQTTLLRKRLDQF